MSGKRIYYGAFTRQGAIGLDGNLARRLETAASRLPSRLSKLLPARAWHTPLAPSPARLNLVRMVCGPKS